MWYYSVTLCVAPVPVCVDSSQRIPLSVLVRNPHKGFAREISQETGRTREGRSARPVDRRGKSRERQNCQQKGAAETSRQNRSVKRWESGREETSRQKSERRLLRPVDLQTPGWPTREFKSALLVALWEFSLEYTFVLAHKNTECTKIVTQTFPLLALGANSSPWLFVYLFFHPFGCIGKEMWNTPGQRWKKSLDDSDGHEWFKEAEIVGSAGGYWHNRIFIPGLFKIVILLINLTKKLPDLYGKRTYKDHLKLWSSY